MKFSASILATALPLAAAVPAAVRRQSNTTAAYKPKVILDNDWSPAGFIPFLQALDAGWEVLGLASDTANSWALQTGLHGLATLEVGNLSNCIPVYKGADWPLIHTPERYQAWKAVHGALPWCVTLPKKEQRRAQITSNKLQGGRFRGGEPDG